MLTILFDGIAYGVLLFVLAAGLAVTLGLMNFVNLSHGVFAMLGGYLTAVLMGRLGLPFLACLPVAFAAAAILGLVLERLLYRHLYRRSHLEQVLFTIGIVFMAVSATDYFMGSGQQPIRLPDFLRQRVEIFGGSVSMYRLFVVALCCIITALLQVLLMRTRFGSRLRAAVDDPQVARGLGINVGLIFAVTFALGSGLAGLGGALAADLFGMDPGFPIKFMIYFLIVVTVGGTTGLTGTFAASILLGVFDVAGKYYVPQAGAFIIYAVMVVVLILRPQGLFARAGAR
jgi:branched-chain amino acid transport system permease protein